VSYFDPNQEKLVDGLEALRTLLASIKNFKGAIKDPRYEMIDPKVQHHGDVVLLNIRDAFREEDARLGPVQYALPHFITCRDVSSK